MQTFKLAKPLNLDKILETPNLCELLDDEDNDAIARICAEGYALDLTSRSEWEERQARANKLALQVYEDKNTPWPNASSVKFPLITVAALQFQARAFPTLIPGTDLAKVRIYGPDPDGSKNARAERIARHMNWQCLEEDAGWEEEHDKLLLVLAIAGCSFIKQTFEPAPGRVVTHLVLPKHFVISYFSRNIEDSPRFTHTFYLSQNEIREREMDGRFRSAKTDDGEEPKPSATVENDEITQAKDERQGIYNPATDDRVTPWFTAEQYCWFDLDGDGYQEPYIVTFDVTSGKIRRMVARFLPSGVKKRGENVYQIKPINLFTKFGFIPSPDGGFYDLGLGSILGPINDSVNTAINQMFDAGTMATLGGGFLGRGWKGKGGPITFAPNQWHQSDASGDDLKKSVLPLPVREPSNVLFQLLGLLLQYGERIVSATDTQMGESTGQNTPAETSRMMDQNGARVYSAIFKRIWRSLRDEFRVRFNLNRNFLDISDNAAELTQGPTALLAPNDYQGDDLDVKPAADPHVVSDAQAEKQANMLMGMAFKIPGFNKYKVIQRWGKAMKIPGFEDIYPQPMTQGPDGKPVPAPDIQMPPNPKMIEAQIKQADQQLREKKFQSDQMEMKITLQMEVQESQATVAKLNAQATNLLASAKTAESEPMIKMLFAQVEAENSKQDRMMKLVDTISRSMEKANGNAGTQPGMEAVAQPPANAPVHPIPGGNGAGAPNGMAPAGL